MIHIGLRLLSVDNHNFGDGPRGAAAFIFGSKDEIYSCANSLACTVTAVPAYHSAFGTSLEEDVAGDVGNFDKRVVLEACYGDPAGVVGTHRVGIGIDVGVVFGGGRRVAVESKEAFLGAEEHFVAVGSEAAK